MTTQRSRRLATALAVPFVVGAFAAAAIAGNNPVDENWWPSEFGADDQAGATNYITAAKRVAAARLVTQGKVATLGMPYSNNMPLVPGRTFTLSIPGYPTHGQPDRRLVGQAHSFDQGHTAGSRHAGSPFFCLSTNKAAGLTS